MKRKKPMRFWWLVFSAAVVSLAHARSVTTNAVTYLDEDASILWRTITSFPAKIALEWPSGSVRAVLTSKIGPRAEQSVTIEDVSLTSCSVAFNPAVKRSDRETVELAISYLDAEGQTISSDTVHLGLVDGIGNGACAATRLNADSLGWRRFKGHEVVQIPKGAQSVEIDGRNGQCEIPGYYRLDPGSGYHTLTLNSADGSAEATVLKSADGLIITFN